MKKFITGLVLLTSFSSFSSDECRLAIEEHREALAERDVRSLEIEESIKNLEEKIIEAEKSLKKIANILEYESSRQGKVEFFINAKGMFVREIERLEKIINLEKMSSSNHESIIRISEMQRRASCS